MDAWLAENAQFLTMVLAIATAVLFVLAVVFAILWAVNARGRRKQYLTRVAAERQRLDTDVELQEQLGRLRIVRELHEVAVHSVSVIISQADGAQYAAKTYPDAAVRSAAVIADTARSTLADLRRVMSVVQDGEAASSPQPRLKTARDLFAVMRESGLDIEFLETGQRFELKEGAELAIYRILQEALSNALEYGGEGTRVKVAFTWTEEGLQVLVDDEGARTAAVRDGRDPNAESRQRPYTIDEDLHALTNVVSGPGITEMRERAALFGGILNAYAVPGVGFSISAIFPALRYDNGVHGVNLDPS